MSLPTNLQNGLSISDYGVITTPNQPIDLNRNPIITTGTNSTVLATINQRVQQNSIPQYRFPLDLPKYNFTIIQHENSQARTFEVNTRRYIGQVTGVYRLPLPTRLADSHSTEFADAAPLDMALNLAKVTIGAFRLSKIAAIAAALRINVRAKGKVISRKQSERIATMVTNEQNPIFQKLDVASEYIGAAAGIIGTGATMLGIKIANAKVVSIAEPNFRSFSLSWNFAPKNYRESLEIQKICYNLKKFMTPDRALGGYVNYFPSVYTMFFQPNVKFLYKFKPCVLTSVSVDYQPGDVPAFYRPENGNQQLSPPQTVILNTTWLELDYFVQQHYDNDHNDDEDLPSNDPYGVLKDSFTFSE